MLDQTCTVNVAPVTIDAYGIPTNGTAVSTASRCAIQADSTREGIEYQRETGRVRFRVYFPPATTLVTKGTITATSGPYNGRTFESLSPAIDDSGRGTGNYRKVLCTEVI